MGKKSKKKRTNFFVEKNGMIFTGPRHQALINSINKQMEEGFEGSVAFRPKVLLRKKSGEVREIIPRRINRAMMGNGF